MKVFQVILLLFLIIPFVEIYLLLTVGGLIGVIPTIFLVVFTAVLGAALLRQQGFETLRRFQASLNQGVVPAYEMIEGPILLIGGALLLTPGFFTDALGFACLVPQLRNKIAKYVIENHLIQADGSFHANRPKDTDFLEGEYKKED